MRVDAHVHVFAAASERYPREVTEQAPAERSATLEALERVLDGAGIDRAVLVGLDHHDEYIVESVAARPGRFAAIGVRDPHAVDAVADWEGRSHLRGLRLFEAPPAPLLARLRDDGAILWFYSSLAGLEALERCLDAHGLDDLDVVLNHLGFPWPERLETDELGRPRIATELPPPTLPVLRRLARFPRVRVMLSGAYAFSRRPSPYEDVAPVAAAVAEAYGPQRLLWASDWPWIAEVPGYDACLEQVDRLLPGLTSAERDRVLGGTAAELVWGEEVTP